MAALMNAIIFQLKRAHLASMKAGRWLIRVVEDMTPARFDIMIILRQAGLAMAKRDGYEKRATELNGCFVDQGSIVEALGLHKSTVSEALGRLEELGWIERRRGCRDAREDGRRQIVQMTELGLARTAEACKILFRWDIVKRPVDQMVRHLEPALPFNDAFAKVWTTISELARAFGDTSTFAFYDRQISFEPPDFTTWERFTNRLFDCSAGARLPDFVIAFLFRWENHGRRSRFRGHLPHPSYNR